MKIDPADFKTFQSGIYRNQNNKIELQVDYSNLNKTKLNKMKMDELTELYNKLKLEKNNKMLKADMINNILNYLSNHK